MSTTDEPNKTQVDPRVKRIAIFAAILIIVFLAGFVPMFIRAWSRANERDAAQRKLRLCVIQSNLASAVINARRGEYEVARQATSDFFTTLHGQVEMPNNQSDFTPQQRDSLKPLMNERDNLITLLARGDPASADRLSDLFVAYQKVFGKSMQ